MNHLPERDRLDNLLDQSRPSTTLMTDEVLDELSRLRVATMPAPGSVRRR
jgi:hypothetical protein